MTQHHHWHPTWYNSEHESGWDRVKDAFRRDWMQTKHDLHMGGHELNQRGSDTLKQAAGKTPIPNINDATPPHVAGDLDGDWERVEPSLEYGYSARRQFGERYLEWNGELESHLRREWEAAGQTSRDADSWDRVQPFVRRGYDYKS